MKLHKLRGSAVDNIVSVRISVSHKLVRIISTYTRRMASFWSRYGAQTFYKIVVFLILAAAVYSGFNFAAYIIRGRWIIFL